MGCCKYCLLLTLVTIVGLGIAGFIFRDKVIHEYDVIVSRGITSWYNDVSEEINQKVFDESEETESSESKSDESKEKDVKEPKEFGVPNVDSDEDSDEVFTTLDSDEDDDTTTTTTQMPSTTTSTQRPSSTTTRPISTTQSTTTTSQPKISSTTLTSFTTTMVHSGSGDDSHSEKIKGVLKDSDDEDYGEEEEGSN